MTRASDTTPRDTLDAVRELNESDISSALEIVQHGSGTATMWHLLRDGRTIGRYQVRRSAEMVMVDMLMRAR